MGLIARIRSGTYVPDDDPAVATPGVRLTLRDAGALVTAGEDPLAVIRDVLDQAGRANADALATMIDERPARTGNARADALFAGVAEHLAVEREISCPAWAGESERFLDTFWFVSPEPGFRAIALAQSPMSLKRRGILWPARSLQRV